MAHIAVSTRETEIVVLSDTEDLATRNSHSRGIVDTVASTHVVGPVEDSDSEQEYENAVAENVYNLQALREKQRSRKARQTERMQKLKQVVEHKEQKYTTAKAQWQREVISMQESLDESQQELQRLRKQLKQLRQMNKVLKGHIQQQEHLICDICGDSQKCRVTRCGHGYCAQCLANWAEHQVGSFSCPACRKPLDSQCDIWPIYLDAGSKSITT